MVSELSQVSSRTFWFWNFFSVKALWREGFYSRLLQSFYPPISFCQGNNFKFSSSLLLFSSSKPHDCLWDYQEILRLSGNMYSSCTKYYKSTSSFPKRSFQCLLVFIRQVKERTLARMAMLNQTKGPFSPTSWLWKMTREASKVMQRYFCLLSPHTHTSEIWDFLSMK